MGNNENNSQLIQLLCTFNIGEKVEPVCCQDCMVRHDEADITLSSYMLYAVREGTHRVRIFYVKTLCVPFLMWWSWKANVEADVQFDNWDGTVLSNIATVISVDSMFEDILASHVLWDWDTTSLGPYHAAEWRQWHWTCFADEEQLQGWIRWEIW